MRLTTIGLLWASANIAATALTIFDVLPNSVMAWVIPLFSVASIVHINTMAARQGQACGNCAKRGS